MEHATRDEKCATQKEWPFCVDDDWYSKCPSGCRIQGLLDKNDHELLKKIKKIRDLLDQHKARHRSVDLVSKQTYDILREKLTLDSGNDNMYYNLAQTLRQRITEMKIKIDRQQKVLAALRDRVKDQVVEMQKMEVDIDIKLRSCKGSCLDHTEYQVDKESYVSLEKQVNQLDSNTVQSSPGSLYVMKSRPLKDVVVDSRFKSKDVAGQQREDVFPQVNTVQFILEEEGSSSSPATVSKVPGTSHSSSSSSFSSFSATSAPSSSKSITELSGRGDGDFLGGFGGTEFLGQPSVGHVNTKTVSCTKTIRRTIVHTKDGPVERVEEVGGGPECGGLTKGDMSSLFPAFTGSSSSSSSSSSFHSGGTKGILADTKSGFNPFGADFGAFMTDNAEDDVPDFHARSVKSTVVERQDGFVGTGTKTADLE